MPDDYSDLINDTQDLIKEQEATILDNSDVRITANQANGFHRVILNLLGDYEPIVKDYTYTSTQGYTSHSIDITPDYSWISSAAIFLVVLVCCFRLLGGLLCRKR